MNTQTSLYTAASFLAILTPEEIPAHVAKLKAHLAIRKADHDAGRRSASNSKVMNQIKREIAHFEKL